MLALSVHHGAILDGNGRHPYPFVMSSMMTTGFRGVDSVTTSALLQPTGCFD